VLHAALELPLGHAPTIDKPVLAGDGESRAHPPVDSGNPTVASVVEAFLLHDERHSGPRTHAERNYYLQLFCEAHGRKLLSECKSFHLKDWLAAHDEWQNPSTKGNIIRCVKRAFNWAVKDEQVLRNPFLGVEQPKRNRRRPVTQEEFDSLVAAAGKKKRLARFVEALRFIKWAGARPCEVEAVRWEHLHIDLDKGQGVIILPEHKTAKATKDHSPRVIQLIDPVVQLLLEIKRRGDHAQYVFVGKGKKPWSRNGLQQNVRRLRREIGLDEKVVLYGIRHEFATRSIRNGWR
jgi:integrase